MSQPILTLQETKPAPKGAANLLPCRIHHNGSIDPVEGYWTPTEGEDGLGVVYFRGRKLCGKKIKLPEQFRGVVAQRRSVEESQSLSSTEPKHDETGPEQPKKSETMQITAEFDDIVIWGHELPVDEAEDPYVRGIEEWLQISEQIHSYEEANNEVKK